MSSLLALLSRQTPNLQTRKGMIITGLQHDFLSPEGKLPVSTDSGFVDRLEELVTEFRSYGDVIWVRSEFEATRHPSDLDEDGCNVITSSAKLVAGTSSQDERSESESPKPSRKRKAGADSASSTKSNPEAEQKQFVQTTGETTSLPDDANDFDEELFLAKSSEREPCCVKGTIGADFTEPIKRLVQERDLQVVKSYYSAFSSTSLLLTLRSKLITELYICGCMTNMSVYATAMDAARYGIKIVLVQDCLGYRRRERHDLAMKRLVDIMGARVTTSEKVIEELRNPSYSDEDQDDSEDGDSIQVGEDAAQAGGVDPLEVDSDEEDEEDPTTVRSSHLFAQQLELRFRRPERRHLPGAVGESESRLAAQHPEPAHATSSESRNRPFEGRKVGSSKVKEGFRSIGRDPVVRPMQTSGDSSLAAKERSRQVNSKQPWLDMLPSHPPSSTPTSKYRDITSQVTLARLDQETINKYKAAATKAKRTAKWHKVADLVERPRCLPLFGAAKKQESADSRITYDLLPPDLVDGLFSRLNREMEWQGMRHQTGEVPRLVCCQGSIGEDGSMPIYRHPADQTVPLSPWTSAVDVIRKAAESVAGHELNHALIQLYRGGVDFISEHSDKTIDIVPSSNIVNVSFGAERVMRLRTKRVAGASGSPGSTLHSQQPQRTTYRIRLPHNSALTMSLVTNAEYLHGIIADKRRTAELTDAERAYSGQRISLTFRHIGTFIDKDSSLIWGQGAVGKTREEAKKTVNGDEAESDRLVRAFGQENQASSIQWETWYGHGSDVLHLK